MKFLNFAVVFASVFISTAVRADSEDELFHAGGMFDYCVSTFYDHDMYGWYSYRNSCSEDINVVFGGNNRSHSEGSMELRPGRHSSTGLTRSEVNSRSGLSAAICRRNYIPVDASNHSWRPGDSYRCKRLL